MKNGAQSMVIIRLHTLSSRAPSMQDAYKVAELIHICDKNAFSLGQHHEEEIKAAWQRPRFHLMTDAWIIATKNDQFVGYADVQQNFEQSDEGFTLTLYVHPDFQSRGIETLLIRSSEERIRQISWSIVPSWPIKVSISVKCGNYQLDAMIQHEGYALVRQFLRMHIAMEQITHQALGVCDGLMTLDVPLSTDNGKNTLPDTEKVDAYTAKLYDVYEKVLACGMVRKKEREIVPAMQGTAV
jgi:GNAT superfamily N-acetyltransferase